MKCFVDGQQRIGNPLLRFRGNIQRFFLLLTATYGQQ